MSIPRKADTHTSLGSADDSALLAIHHMGVDILGRGGNEPSRAELGSAWLAAACSCNEPSAARLAHLASSKKRLGLTRSWLASRLAEPTSLAINVNLLSKL
jgi:hypothetical protein